VSKQQFNVPRMHQIGTHMQELAYELYQQRGHLDDSDFRQFLFEPDEASSYCLQQFRRFENIDTEVWRLRIALAWDMFPTRRKRTLSACQQIYHEIATMLPAWIQKGIAKESLILPRLLAWLGDAGRVFQLPEELTTEEFIKGIGALGEVAMIFFATREGTRWDAEKHFYQQLYDILVPLNTREEQG
jgi:hypothetical protein